MRPILTSAPNSDGPTSEGPTSDGPTSHRGPPPSPFRFAIFRDVWIANLASRFGGMIQSVGAAWVMLSLGASPVLVSLVQAANTLPIMVFALVAGALADTYDRRRLMIAAQGFMLVVSTLLALVAWAGLLTPWLLLLFTFLIGSGAALNGPAWQASVGEMVPRPVLPAAVAYNSMGFNVARSVGPAVGGVLVAAIGAAFAFAVNALTYLPLLFVLARWRPAVAALSKLPREPLGAAMLAGIRYATLSPGIAAVLARAAVFGIGASAVPALLPLAARDLMRGGAQTYGLLLGAFGIGAVIGALASPRLRQWLSSENVVRAALAALAVGGIGMAFSHSLGLTLLALLLAGGGWVLALSTFNVTVQMSAPRWVVARALALYQMATFGGMAVGSAVWGSITEAHGLPEALLGAATVLALCLVIGLVRPLADIADVDLDPLGRWQEPAIAVAIEPRSGPIVVTIEYRIAAVDIPAFLAIMADRRRIRRRDGARDWSLLRDLTTPELWIERYQTPTWTDYVRHNGRMTQADGSVGDELRRLHIGPDRPVVRRLIERQTRPPQGIDTPQMVLTDPAQQA